MADAPGISGATGRILGVDYARALAIIGMMGAHIGDTPNFTLVEPGTWPGIIYGNSSMLFGLLAGVSIALMTGGTRIPSVDEADLHRRRLFGRGAFIFALGVLLELLGTVVAVILTTYGVFYLVVLPMLRWRRRRLVVVAAVIALFGPVVAMLNYDYAMMLYAPGFSFLFGGMYQFTTYFPLLLLGLALGRSDLRRTSMQVMLACGGLGVWLLGQVTGALLGEPPLEQPELFALISLEPHSGSLLELLSSGGFAVGLLGLCLLIPSALAGVLRPLSALGAMPLTIYSGHLIAIALLWPGGMLPLDNTAWLWFTVVALTVAPLWFVWFRKGPLERVAAWIGMRSAGERARRAG